jgi:hypothetical protein
MHAMTLPYCAECDSRAELLRKADQYDAAGPGWAGFASALRAAASAIRCREDACPPAASDRRAA